MVQRHQRGHLPRTSEPVYGPHQGYGLGTLHRRVRSPYMGAIPVPASVLVNSRPALGCGPRRRRPFCINISAVSHLSAPVQVRQRRVRAGTPSPAPTSPRHRRLTRGQFPCSSRRSPCRRRRTDTHNHIYCCDRCPPFARLNPAPVSAVPNVPACACIFVCLVIIVCYCVCLPSLP